MLERIEERKHANAQSHAFDGAIELSLVSEVLNVSEQLHWRPFVVSKNGRYAPASENDDEGLPRTRTTRPRRRDEDTRPPWTRTTARDSREQGRRGRDEGTRHDFRGRGRDVEGCEL